MTVQIKKRLSLLLAVLLAGPAIALGPTNNIISRLSISLQLNAFIEGRATLIRGPHLKLKNSHRCRWGMEAGDEVPRRDCHRHQDLHEHS